MSKRLLSGLRAPWIRYVLVSVLCAAACGTVCAEAAAPGMNGKWLLDEGASDNLEDSARKRNDELNVEWRARRENKFGRDDAPQGRDRFQSQLDATERMISEDSRTIDWGGPDHLREILEARSIKLYQGRKVAILYDGERKRLLSVNPAGRAFSVSGTEITTDDVGRTLTFFEGGSLVIETSVHGAGTLVETYTADGDAQAMTQAFTVQERPGGPTLEFKRRFKRAD